MAKLDDMLEFLNTLIQSTIDGMVNINRDNLYDIKNGLQNAWEKIYFLQPEQQFQQEELKQKSCHFEPICVQNIETNSHWQQETIQIIEPSTRAYLHAEANILPALPKRIIKHWEEIVHNKHRTDLGYDKDFSFHILEYSKPIKFQSVGFLYGNSPSAFPEPAPLPKQ